MNHAFSRVPRADIPRSSFDRSHGHKTTFDSGLLIPIFVDEALPGDTFNVSMTGFARMATPIKPVMDNSYFTTFFFAVPIRLLWDNWERFNGAQTTPGASTDYLVPEVSVAAPGWSIGSIGDYMGLPTGVGCKHSALWMRAYNLIYNEWFRDQNLQNPTTILTGDGPDPAATYGLKRRGKRHDYFTSSLPWPQKGQSVTIPLGTTAPVIGNPSPGLNVPSFTNTGMGPAQIFTNPTNTNVTFGIQGTNNNAVAWATPGLIADLSTATASTINQLRQAFAVQRLYERDARGGTRYTEIVRSHFGVVSPDARLQRPEYLGGGRSPVTLHTVSQTQATPASPGTGTPQGNLSAYGTASLHRHGFTKGFTEHCVLLGLVCVTADLNYQQGLARMWSRRRRFDFYWPALSHIGEQSVLSKEIYADGSAGDETVWGYQERFAEYRYKPNQITGKFRSTDPTSLDVWHLAQEFATRPLLNNAFIEENPPFDRVVAVPDEPHFIADFHFNMRCARPMPVYGVPGMIDHF